MMSLNVRVLMSQLRPDNDLQEHSSHVGGQRSQIDGCVPVDPAISSQLLICVCPGRRRHRYTDNHFLFHRSLQGVNVYLTEEEKTSGHTVNRNSWVNNRIPLQTGEDEDEPGIITSSSSSSPSSQLNQPLQPFSNTSAVILCHYLTIYAKNTHSLSLKDKDVCAHVCLIQFQLKTTWSSFKQWAGCSQRPSLHQLCSHGAPLVLTPLAAMNANQNPRRDRSSLHDWICKQAETHNFWSTDTEWRQWGEVDVLIWINTKS